MMERLLLLLAVVTVAFAASQELQAVTVNHTLSDGVLSRLDIRVGVRAFFHFDVPIAGTSCMYPCEGVVNDMWVRVDLHTQYVPVLMMVSKYVPVSKGTDVSIANGTNIGVVERIGAWNNTWGDDCVQSSSYWSPPPSVRVYIEVRPMNFSGAPATITIGIRAEAFPIDPPVPGGCCTTCLIENDPSISLSFNKYSTKIQFQQSDLGIPLSGGPGQHSCDCDFISGQTEVSTVKYELYRLYIPQDAASYHKEFHVPDMLDAIEHMSSVAGLLQYADKVDDGDFDAVSLKIKSVNSVVGQGVVYNVLVTDLMQQAAHPNNPTKYQSVYTPVSTYACSFMDEPGLPACSFSMDIGVTVTAVFCIIMGLFIAIFGHRFFKTEIVAFSFMLVAGGMFIVMTYEKPDSSHALRMGVSAAVGAVAAFLFLALWYFYDAQGTAMLCVALTLGSIMAAFAFATPLGNIKLFTNNFNYGMSFTCLVLIHPVFVLLKPRIGSIVSCAIVGSYAFLGGVDYFVGSNFREILLNVFSHISVPDYAKNYDGNIFRDEYNGIADLKLNMIMLSAWGAMTIVCILIQLWITPKRLPASRYTQRKHDWEGQPLLQLAEPNIRDYGSRSPTRPAATRQAKQPARFASAPPPAWGVNDDSTS